MRKCFAIFALLAASTWASAGAQYDKLEVGSVVQGGIELGGFQKPIPLPEGEWLVVSQRKDDMEFTRRNSTFKLPRYSFTLKNKQVDSPLYAMVMSISPDAMHINWNNGKCANANEKAIVDDFGLSPDSVSYLCAVGWQISNYKERVTTSATSDNKWRQMYLPGLIPYVDDVSDASLEVWFSANIYKGVNINATYMLKRTGDTYKDPAYLAYVKNWIHTTGLALGDVVANKEAHIEAPKPYVAQ